MRIILNRRTYRWNRRSVRNPVLIIVSVICFLMIIYRHVCGFSYDPVFQLVKRTIQYSTNFNRLASEVVQLSQQRAIIIYYPQHDEKTYFPEFRWLYRSWIEMMITGEPKQWRTDLLIFTAKMTLNFEKLGCLFEQMRKNAVEPPQCRVFRYEPVSTRHSHINLTRPIDIERSKLLYKYLQNYEYIDSINVIVEGYSIFSQYNSILRTDIDVFLTKYFGSYAPSSNNTLFVGLGGYSTEFNTNRLRRIAKDIGWNYANLTGIGSTWYGSPHLAHRVANFTLTAMLHLTMHEFSTVEKQDKFGAQLWPDWHYGVILLYGSHLAVNHLVLTEKLDIRIAKELLDQSVTNTDQYDIEKNTRLHLHCWHTDLPFSKFHFKANRYNCINPLSFINDTSARAYAMRMALESRYFTLEQMTELKKDIQNKKLYKF